MISILLLLLFLLLLLLLLLLFSLLLLLLLLHMIIIMIIIILLLLLTCLYTRKKSGHFSRIQARSGSVRFRQKIVATRSRIPRPVRQCRLSSRLSRRRRVRRTKFQRFP